MAMVVSVHCGNAHVKGRARLYTHYVASIFETVRGKNGEIRWVNTGVHTRPRRSYRLAEQDGQKLAEKYGAIFVETGHSLHNLTHVERKTQDVGSSTTDGQDAS